MELRAHTWDSGEGGGSLTSSCCGAISVASQAPQPSSQAPQPSSCSSSLLMAHRHIMSHASTTD